VSVVLMALLAPIPYQSRIALTEYNLTHVLQDVAEQSPLLPLLPVKTHACVRTIL